ncbi:MAG: nitroreductase family protein [Nitrososphaerales archaeon]|nr:nitroreductase family protein [Nitrososphaerales archaeon]
MDTFDCIATKLEPTEYAEKRVPTDVKKKVLEAARLTASGVNYQHWRFVLIQDPARVKKLADDSTTGHWVGGADFAVLVLTNPKYNFHAFDAGRVVQDMELAAWNYGVASRVFTGFDKEKVARDFALPSDLSLTVAVGFGYPAKKLLGRKNRRPLGEIAFLDRYGQKLQL